jgi:hypothetical protein
MTNWRKFIPTALVFGVVALCLPVVASAQYGDYGRNGGYGNNGGYNGNDRGLRDAIKRVKDRSGDFRKHLDQALDHSRINGSNREDQINNLAGRFHDAADELKDSFGNGRNNNYGRSQQDAQRLVQLAAQIDRSIGRARLDGRSQSDWYQISNDLNYIANSFGIDRRYGNGGYNGGYGNGRGGRGRDRNQYPGSRWP